MTADAPDLADGPEPEADAAGEEAAESLRAELEGLVRIAARRPNLTVQVGEPDCTWSFNWDSDVVTVNPIHLRSLAPDLCRGLALHEAAHAAVTVLHRIVVPTVLTRLHPLLNTLEDIRIEIWMRKRFPGAGDWIRAYNDVFYGSSRSEPVPQSRQVQFLTGVLHLWWYGTTVAGLHAEVLDALDACRDPIAAATSCQPPLNDDTDGILASQRAMWEIVRDRIVPIWERLVALDRREGIGRLASHELREFAERHQGGRRLGEACRRGRQARKRRGGGAGSDSPAATPHSPPPSATDSDHYLTAWRQVAQTADRLGDELLRLLLPRQRMQWSAGHPWGPRLELRRAMQFEADMQQYRSLWSRPILPHRCDPAVILLVDRSASMVEGNRISRAFEGMVLLTEVCRRIGIPAAVWSFARDVRRELDWDEPVSAEVRQRLGRLPGSCDGNTKMATALAAVGEALAARRGDPKLLFVISDGDPSDHADTCTAFSRIEAEGVVSVGLGLGPGTAGLGRYLSNVVTEIPPERLVDHVADLLGGALLAHA